MMRSNFEFTGKQSLTRMHLQVLNIIFDFQLFASLLTSTIKCF